MNPSQIFQSYFPITIIFRARRQVNKERFAQAHKDKIHGIWADFLGVLLT
jgi:hypothetical protein